jgi:transcription elongation GreA/GreB family factor
MTVKQKIHHHFLQLVQDRIDIFRDMISALTEDSKNDAKGSAGDKHETSLSMMHIEQEKLTAKLKECLDQKAILGKIDAAQAHNKVALGSLVTTNKLMVYLCTALPKTNLQNQNIFAISPQSPLAEKILGNQVGFEFDMNGVQYTILEIE